MAMPKVLVIDDSPSALQVVETILAGAGYLVTTSTDGKHAVEMLRHEAFDLVLTDLYMPDEDGLEVIRDARRIRPGLPIVAMSGVTGPRNMLDVARHLGACQVLQKPFSCEELLAAVRSVPSLTPAGLSALSDEVSAGTAAEEPVAGKSGSKSPNPPNWGTHQ
jgi:CheY-like chemotaxis protein